MTFYNRRCQKSARRRLRTEGTSAEAVLWLALQKRQVAGRRFRRQFGVGPYILDFYCPAERLAVELDGAVHNTPEARAYDAARDAWLAVQGIRVLRFENRVVFEDPDGLLAAVVAAFAGDPLPAFGGTPPL